MKRIFIAIAAVIVLSASSCAFTKTIDKHCDIIASGNFKDKFRVVIECDSLSKLAKDLKAQQTQPATK